MNVQRGNVFWQPQKHYWSFQMSEVKGKALPEGIATLNVQGIGHFLTRLFEVKESCGKAVARLSFEPWFWMRNCSCPREGR